MQPTDSDHDHGMAATPQRTVTFDGAPITARPGQSVGAALVEAGITSWRTTRRNGRPRGLFCGIGICYDCLLTVEGRPNQRACLVPAEDGMQLSSAGSTAAPAAGNQEEQ